MARTVTRRAPAKINLYLHVTGKRDDGYHLLDSLTVFTPDLADIITVEESDRFGFEVFGPLADHLSEGERSGGWDSSNIVARAARIFCEAAPAAPCFKISLEKHIPLGAGLGGGSADAAATIHALEEFTGKILSAEKRDLALIQLGADVPVCYRSRPTRFEGIGEILSEAPPLPRLHMLLIWPDCHTATREVFARRAQAFTKSRIDVPEQLGSWQEFTAFLLGTENDLSEAAESIYENILEARRFVSQLPGCAAARMSGSGSTVFGLFEKKEDRDSAEIAAKARNSAWWVHASDI